jgi:hypothetical protein
MNALSASWWSMGVLVSFGGAGLVQKSTASKQSEVHSIPIGVLLPRQAGSKDAPALKAERIRAAVWYLEAVDR